MKPGPQKGFHPKNEIKKGHKWSEESIRKSAEKRSKILKVKGIKPPSRIGTIPWNKGKTGVYSKETIRKIKEGRAKQVIKHTAETKRKIGIAHSKEKSTFWRGGISETTRTLRANIMSTLEYRQWRSSVFRRDHFTCQHCWTKGGVLNADHIKKFAIILKENKIKTLKEALGCGELWDINNGRTLCIDCHKKTPTYGKFYGKNNIRR